MILTSSQQIKAIDAMAINDYHLPGIILMEHAAMKVMETIEANPPKDGITVVCGTGNNGGDGLAVARLAHLRGFDVEVVIIGDCNRLTPDASTMYRAVLGLDIPVSHIIEVNDLDRLSSHELYLVDALLGIGCSRTLEGIYEAAVLWLNKHSQMTIAVDIPSGIQSDTGNVMGVAVKADITVTFTLPKVGHVIGEGKYACGQLVLVEIGIPQTVLSAFDYKYELIDSSVLKHLPKRSSKGHKMSFGRLLIIAGSETMSGAAILAAKAAYKAGVGLVDVVTHMNGLHALQLALPEAIVHTYQDQEEGHALLGSMTSKLAKYQSVLIGPGLGQTELSEALLSMVLTHCHCPLVIDADGLNLMPRLIDQVDAYDNPIIITPHLGEMSRLTQHDVGQIARESLAFASAYSKAHGLITVLKSDTTVVTDTEDHYCINGMGNHGMATAGSGDVLAGIIAAMIGQGAEPFIAAVLGVGLHSMAGDMAAERISKQGLMASDIIDGLQGIFRDQEET